MNEPNTIEGNAVEREPSTDLAARQAPAAPAAASATLWRTDDPAEVVVRATRLADALAPLLSSKGWVQNFGGDRDHVAIQGWQTLASMAGVASVNPRVVELPWPPDERLTGDLRKIRDSGYAFGYEAAYTAQTLAGVEVGGGEGTCKRTEENWCRRNGAVVDDYALKGMAQTRAQSRCLASPLRFVVELAGFSGTPAEEMQAGMSNGGGGGARRSGGNGGGGRPASDRQVDFLNDRFSKAKLDGDTERALRLWATKDGKLQSKSCSTLIDLLGGGNVTAEVAAFVEEHKLTIGEPVSDVPVDESELPPRDGEPEDGPITDSEGTEF